jgi:hypothetical protein
MTSMQATTSYIVKSFFFLDKTGIAQNRIIDILQVHMFLFGRNVYTGLNVDTKWNEELIKGL